MRPRAESASFELFFVVHLASLEQIVFKGVPNGFTEALELALKHFNLLVGLVNDLLQRRG